MCTTLSSRRASGAERTALAATLLFTALAAPAAHALSSDREQPLDIRADYSRTQLGQGSGDASSGYLRGNVLMVQGTLKATGDEANLYQAAAKPAKSGSGSDSGAQIKRIVLTGKPARLEQQPDGGGGLMRAQAGKIDYDSDSGVATLTGDVEVTQEGRSQMRGSHMTYNTNTGVMDSGEPNPGTQVQLRFLPQPKAPADAAKKPDGAS